MMKFPDLLEGMRTKKLVNSFIWSDSGKNKNHQTAKGNQHHISHQNVNSSELECHHVHNNGIIVSQLG